MRLARLAAGPLAARPELLWAFGTFAGAFALCETTGLGDLLLSFLYGWQYDGERRSWRGLKQGRGTLRTPEGVHVGNFENGVPEGRGIFRHACGDVYEGVFRAGELRGLGTLRTASGDVYSGAFRGSRPEGRGTLRCSSGHVYDGEFRDGRPVGHFRCLAEHESRSSSSQQEESDAVEGCVRQVPSLFTLAVAALTPSRPASPAVLTAGSARCEESAYEGHHARVLSAA